MRRVKVGLGGRSYDIIIGKGVIKCLGPYLRRLGIGQDAYVITNVFLKNKYGAVLKKAFSGFGLRFKTVPDSETSKSFDKAGEVIRDLAAFDRSRKVFVVAFGGGVIGDLSGFVASVYKRGTAYVQLPTTLLAQVDSAIGGKTAIDLDSGKNLVGAFYQPRLVLSDTDFLKTLDRRQISSGMAEVIKYALIRDGKFLRYLEGRREDVFGYDPETLERIVTFCSRVKAEIVSRDEREASGLRTVLNFGHTIGHAIEAACAYKTYNHGEAVGLGMLAASDLSRRLGLINGKLFMRIEDLIKLYSLPVRMKGVLSAKVIKAHYRDKKFSGKHNKLVLISGIARPKLVKNVPLALIKEAVGSIV